MAVNKRDYDNTYLKSIKEQNKKQYQKSNAEYKKKQEEKLFKKSKGGFWSTLGNSALDAGGNLVEGSLNAFEGISDWTRYRSADVLDFFGADKKAKEIRKIADEDTTAGIVSDWNHITAGDLAGTKSEEEIGHFKSVEENSIFGDKADSVFQGVGNSLTGAAVGSYLGAPVASQKAKNIIGMTSFGVSASGSAEEEAIANGATRDEARLYGVLSGTVEAGSEMLFGGLGKVNQALGFSKGALDDVIVNRFTKNMKNSLLRNITTLGIKSVGEGFEEVTSGFGNALAQKLTYMNEEDFKTLLKDQKLMDSFVSGMLSSAIMQSPSTIRYSVQGRDVNTGLTSTQQQYVNEIAQQRMTEAQKRNAKLNGYEKGKIEQRALNDYQQGRLIDTSKLPLRTQQAVNLPGLNAQTGAVTQSSVKGMDLQQSAYYHGLNPNSEAVVGMKAFLDNRDIVGRFDADEFKGSNENAFWRKNENGTREVILNPNANADVILEELAIHELTHDLMSSKNSKDVISNQKIMDYVSTLDGYEEARKAVEKKYKKQTDKLETTEEKIAYINEEIVADTLGKNIGSQEYIRRLIDEEPSIAKNIYDWVVNKVANKNGVKNEKAYWNNVKNNFEKAYNMEYQGKGSKGDTKFAIANTEFANLTPNQQKRLDRAEELRKEGKTSKEIWSKTGFEYRDNKSYDFYVEDLKFKKTLNVKTGQAYNIEEVLEGELLDTYPFLRNKEIVMEDLIKDAQRDGVTNTEYLKQLKGVQGATTTDGKLVLNTRNLKSTQEATNVLSHEIQHLIQDYQENGSEETTYFGIDENGNYYTKGATEKDALAAYRNHKNEIEAEVTRVQNAMTKEQRHKYPLSLLINEVSKHYSVTNSSIKPDKFISNLEKKYGQLLDEWYDNGGSDANAQNKFERNANTNSTNITQNESESHKRNNIANLPGTRKGSKNFTNLYVEHSESDVGENNSESNRNQRQELDNSSFSFKEKQLKIIQNSNPVADDYHTWIRSVDDIKTLEETLQDSDWTDYDEFNPDLTKQDIEDAINSGTIMVYSSYPIEQGIFVSPSRMEAESYSSNGKVYSKEVNIDDVAWIDPTQGQYARVQNNSDIRYSLSETPTQDNKGRQVSKGMQDYMEDSKARTEESNLVTVYHTTTDNGAQFNEFNPVGTDYYRFGDQVVNFYTDSKNMSGSYAYQDYEMADTTKLNDINEAFRYVDKYNNLNKETTGNTFKLFNMGDGTYKLSKESALLEKARDFVDGLSLDEFNQMKDNIFHDTFEEFKGTPYEYALSWNKFSKDLQEKYQEFIKPYVGTEQKVDLENNIINALLRTYPSEEVKTYNNVESMLRTLGEDIGKNDFTARKKYQYEGYVNITNPYIVDADGQMWDSVKSGVDPKIIEQLNKITDEEKKALIQLANESVEKHKTLWTTEDADEWFIYRNKFQDLTDTEQHRIIYHRLGMELEDPNKEVHIEGWVGTRYADRYETLETFAKRYDELAEYYELYHNEISYFQKHYKNILNTNKIEDLNSIDLFDIAYKDFDEEFYEIQFSKDFSTNDIVFDVLEMNKNGSNYDGVIIKNVVDYGGKTDTREPANLYITFASNQFKAVDNENPTEDADIRYSQNEGKWQTFLDKNFEAKGTKTRLGDIKLPGLTNAVQQEVQKQTSNALLPIANELRELNKNLTKVMNPLEISQLTPQDASTTPNLPGINRNKVGDGKSKFFDNINEKTNMLNDEQKAAILSNDDVKYYDKVTNKDSLDKAYARLQENGQSESLRWFNKASENADATDVAEGWILLKQYADSGDTNGMVEVAKKLRDMGTKAGQTVQAFNIMSRLTPEGMVKYAQSELLEAYDNMVKNKSAKWIEENRSKFDLQPNEVQFIMDTMKEVSTMEDGYDKRFKLAQIQKVLTDKLPPTKGAGMKAWMRISMLFNPKTQVRNVAGNALIAPVNAFGDLFASGVDKLVSAKTGVRTTGNFKLKDYASGMKKGLYESYNDFKNGVNTRNIQGNRFEVTEGKNFKERTIIGKSLNAVDNLLSFVLDAGDRAFYEGTFVNSINNQLVLNNTTEVTQDMIDIATQEALSRTWQDNNEYTKFVLNIRKAMNKLNVGGYGLGDVLIPFAKTPANLTKALIDYSPVGLIGTINKGIKLNRSLTNGQYSAKTQHEFVQSLGKATAGTMLYIIGYALAQAGITTGESDEDKDVANFMKNTLGINSYSIKIGDTTFTYDWAQPIAAPFAMMANMVQKEKDGATLGENILSTLDTAGNLLLEQSFMESINTVLNNNEGIATGMQEAIFDLPARAVPTFLKQITDMVDGTQRQTFVKDKPIESMFNLVKAKIPGLSQTLAPSVDTMGRDIQKYGGKNNLFNVFLNPANVNTENVSESAQEIYRLYKETGETNIMPRVAPYYVNKKGEKIILSAQQRTKYQKISGEIIETNVAKLLESTAYQNMSDEKKAEVINDIVNYSYNIAQKEVLGTELSDSYKKAYEYSQIGDISDYYEFRNSIDDTDADTKKASVLNYLYNSDLEDNQIAKLYRNYYSSDKEVNAMLTLRIPMKEFIKYDLADIEGKYSATTGKTISGSKKNATIQFINGLNLTKAQKAILIKNSYNSYDRYDNDIIRYVNTLPGTANEKKVLLKSIGFDNYDKDVVKYINSQNISKEEKEKKLKDLGFTIRNGRVYY